MKQFFIVFICALFGMSTFAAEMVKVGDKAPAFEGTDQDGKLWKLSDHIGKEAVLVYFYPKDETPGCTKQACGLRDRQEAHKKAHISVVGISRDSAESHKKFRQGHNLNFPLLVDTDGKLTSAFGAANADGLRSRRVSILIGRDGKVAHVVDTRDAQVHLDEMDSAIKKLKP